jgi:hypothetical protein
MIEMFYKLYATKAILPRPITVNQTLKNICDMNFRGTRSNMTKRLDMLLTKESVLLCTEWNSYTVKFSEATLPH